LLIDYRKAVTPQSGSTSCRSRDETKPFVSDFRRILVTTDLSEPSKIGLEYALGFGVATKSHVTLLHVIPAITADVSGEYQAALLTGVQEQLNDLVAARRMDGWDIVTKTDIGQPGRIIPWAVKANKADLLIMIVQAKSQPDRAVFGSTAENVVRSATCPILIIPASITSKRSKVRAVSHDLTLSHISSRSIDSP
jgi:nucleotide-binding universal stress UspA family protein